MKDGTLPYLLDAQVGFQLRAATRRHTAIFHATMIEDLTPTQFSVMTRLREVGPCSQNELGRQVHLDPATVKGVVDRLETRKMVVCGADSNDHRRRQVSLTGKGGRVIEAAIGAAEAITAKTLAPLNEAEQRALVRLLRRLT
jgi:MarR family transcriptional regulator, lower aerobic nicotinate degradation pathway regulator